MVQLGITIDFLHMNLSNTQQVILLKFSLHTNAPNFSTNLYLLQLANPIQVDCTEMNAKWFPFGKFLEHVVNLMLSNILAHIFLNSIFFLLSSSILVTCGQANMGFVTLLGCTPTTIPPHVLKVRFFWTFPHFLTTLNMIQVRIEVASFLWVS